MKGSVNILTYHKAKGLEWNIVILESLDFDELSTDEMIRKSFFGINDIITGDAEEGELFPETLYTTSSMVFRLKKESPGRYQSIDNRKRRVCIFK